MLASLKLPTTGTCLLNTKLWQFFPWISCKHLNNSVSSTCIADGKYGHLHEEQKVVRSNHHTSFFNLFMAASLSLALINTYILPTSGFLLKMGSIRTDDQNPTKQNGRSVKGRKSGSLEQDKGRMEEQPKSGGPDRNCLTQTGILKCYPPFPYFCISFFYSFCLLFQLSCS